MFQRSLLHRLVVGAAVSFVMHPALAAEQAPCAHMARVAPSDARTAAALAAQLDAPSAKVLQSFAYKTWRILYVQTPTADEAYLFFSGDPATHHYVTLWSGAAAPGEADSIRAWAIENAPGIPEARVVLRGSRHALHRDM